MSITNIEGSRPYMFNDAIKSAEKLFNLVNEAAKKDLNYVEFVDYIREEYKMFKQEYKNKGSLTPELRAIWEEAMILNVRDPHCWMAALTDIKIELQDAGEGVQYVNN